MCFIFIGQFEAMFSRPELFIQFVDIILEDFTKGEALTLVEKIEDITGIKLKNESSCFVW
jgi:hypothetical protein